MDISFAIDGFVVQVGQGGSEEPMLKSQVENACDAVLGDGWQLISDWSCPETEENPATFGYSLIPKTEKLFSAGQAWEHARNLQQTLKSDLSEAAASALEVVPSSPLLGGMGHIEPHPAAIDKKTKEAKADTPGKSSAWHVRLLDNLKSLWRGLTQLFSNMRPAAANPDPDCLPENLDINNPLWPLCITRVPEAQNGHGVKGDGIRVGHPDTGYTPHEQLLDLPNDRLLAEIGKDCFEWNDEDGPLDGMRGRPPLKFPGHGTATASVLMSGQQPLVLGAAPQAALVPCRVANTVALGLPQMRRNLACAIRHATDERCDIISISMGWLWGHPQLHEAIIYAIQNGVIVLGATGQIQFTDLPIRPPIIFPARYDEVIAVAASNIHGEGTSWSANGSQVDVTAPGEDVWRAIASDSHQEVGHGSGTSYSAPLVAGIAAMWLERWQDELIIIEQQLGTREFRHGLFRHVIHHCGLDPIGPKWGAGIVDAVKILDYDWRIDWFPQIAESEQAEDRLNTLTAVIADPSINRTMFSSPPSGQSSEVDDLALVLREYLPPEYTDEEVKQAVGQAIGSAFNVKANEVDDFLAEFGAELVFHIEFDEEQRDLFVQGVLAKLPGEGGDQEVSTLAVREAGGDFLGGASQQLQSHIRS